MKLIQHLLAGFALIVVSISVCIPTSSRRWNRDESHRYGPDRLPSAEASGERQWLAVPTSQDAKGRGFWEGNLLLKRSEDLLQSPNDPTEPLIDDLKSGPGMASHAEAQDVLSPKEFEKFIEMWKGMKAYSRARYAAKQAGAEGLMVAPEVLDEIELNKPKIAPYEKLMHVVERRLIKSGKAREETKALVQRRAAAKKKRDRARRDEIGALEARIKKGPVSMQDKAAGGSELGGDGNQARTETDASWDQGEGGQIARRDGEDTEDGDEPKAQHSEAKSKSKNIAKAEAKPEAKRERRTKEKGTHDPKSRELELAEEQEWAQTDHHAKKIKPEAFRAGVEDPEAKTTPEDGKGWNDVEAPHLTRNERTRHPQARKRAKKIKAATEDESNPPRNKPSSENQSRRVDDVNHHSLQSFTDPFVSQARQWIDNLHDNWQAIPWSSYLPSSNPNKPGGKWSTNQPSYFPPVIQRMPLNVLP
ncbi:MAG: hypothetical protein M1816_000765 [Peltula sp. TS41687]|nr:MAG: hypothetical protein M1816_000765 [Peltula sp. TS41687]